VERVAVLTSGGLDSCVLLADLARENTVYPIYVEFGLAWEKAEQAALRGHFEITYNL
jgi:tRNA(Ile)-lysidine synthase TilS/MesJ